MLLDLFFVVCKSVSFFSRCLAGVDLLLPLTRLTLHVAAPAYLAVAGHGGEMHGRVVTPPTAQTLTGGVLGTGAAACARRVARWPAEAGGVFHEDQVRTAQALALPARSRELGLSRGCVSDT